ncbi:MAG: hypothetical protein ABIP02_04710, partial [Arenimonas sp.]
LIDNGYSISQIQLSLPHLEDQKEIEAEISGLLRQGKTSVGFGGPLTIAKAGLKSEFMLESKGELNFGDKPLPYQIKTQGTFASLEKSFDIHSKTLSWMGESPLPNLQANLNLSIGDNLKIDSNGIISEWPKDWPTLPAPLNQQTKNIPYQLNYVGKLDLSDAIALKLDIDKSQFSSSVRISDMQQWIEQADGSPLPPLQGTFDMPLIQLDGVRLEGVSIEITPDATQ